MVGKYLPFLTMVCTVLCVRAAPRSEAAASDSSGGGCCVKVDNLNLRIDSLEARIEGLQIQLVEADPFKSGKSLQWGKGPTIAIVKSEQRISIDAGYTFLTPKSFRMGVAAGFDATLGAGCSLPDYGLYGKATYGSSVFVNFISFESYIRALFYPNAALNDDKQTTGAVGAGAELEFWLTPACCYTLGGSMTFMRVRGSFDTITQGEINFLGFKYYPKHSRKKR